MTPIGTTRTGAPIHRVTIGSGALSASLLTLGVALQDVRLSGVPHSLTVGSPDPNAYETDMEYFGTIVGPVANRIAHARAEIDGQTHQFDANLDGKHTLHGGSAATHNKLWTLADHGPCYAEFHLPQSHGTGGFPGNRHLSARYCITDQTLRLDLTATTDAATLMNPANHSYWRLSDTTTFAGHYLQIDADHYLPSTPDYFLPTGDIAPVDNTRFDYRSPQQLHAGAEGLIDNNFCLKPANTLRHVARLSGPTGITMDMATTAPGLQVFDGHILEMPRFPGNDGTPYRAYAGLALEAQFWPDAPNNPDFPNIILHPGETWRQTTTWTFNT